MKATCAPCYGDGGDFYGKPCDVCKGTGEIEVAVGTPGTYTIGSDHYPCTVVDVTEQTIVVQPDSVKGGGKLFTPGGEGGKKMRFRFVRGGWRLRYYTLTLGKREIRLDPSF